MMTIKFKTANAAFREEDGGGLEWQSIEILKEIIEKLEYGTKEGNCFDVNGNKVGEWKLRQEKIMITRKEFNEMSFAQAWDYCCKQSDCFTDRDTLRASAIQQVQIDNLSIALHLLNTLNNNPFVQYWFYVDGTTCNLTPIYDKEDLEEFIDIEEGKQQYLVQFTGTQVVEIDVDDTMSKEDIQNKVLEKLCNYAEDIQYIANDDTNDVLYEYFK